MFFLKNGRNYIHATVGFWSCLPFLKRKRIKSKWLLGLAPVCYGPIWTHTGPYGPMWAHMGPAHMDLYGPIWAIWGHTGPHAKTPCTKTHLSSSRYFMMPFINSPPPCCKTTTEKTQWLHSGSTVALHGNPWNFLEILGIFGYMGPIWAHMGPIWTHMGPYGPIWDHMGPYGPIWTRKIHKNM